MIRGGWGAIETECKLFGDRQRPNLLQVATKGELSARIGCSFDGVLFHLLEVKWEIEEGETVFVGGFFLHPVGEGDP